MIANGCILPCKGKCRNVRISIGDYKFYSNMFSMPLGRCDVILGTQWLRTLGPILWDFVELWMHFLVNGKKHTFNGLQPGSLSIISSHRMENLIKKNSHGVIAQLHSIQMKPLAVSTTPLALQNFFDRYACFFASDQWNFHLQDHMTIVFRSFLDASLPTSGPSLHRFG